MSVVNDIIKDIPIPELVKVKQSFDRTSLEDIEDTLYREIKTEKIMSRIHPGQSIAVAVGSRGINHHGLITKTVVSVLKELGADPFIVASMGSHGGATVEGQKSILDGYNITEEYCGCPVKIGTEVSLIGYTDDSKPVYIDKFAAEADGIVLINRIKPHTAFRGPYESGLMKMMAIGLGKQKGAEICHAAGFENMAENIPKFGNAVLKNSNVIFGLAILENAYDETRELIALTSEEIPVKEPELLERAMSYMPKILPSCTDLLVVGRIGKNYSGDGMDPNISGTFATKCASGGVKSQRVAVLDITEESHGNGVGFGMADVSTKKAADKFDPEMSYPNALTCLVSQVVKIPMIFDNDRLCIQAGIKLCADVDYSDVRVIYVDNTLQLENIYVSKNMVEEVRDIPGVTIDGDSMPLKFNDEGNVVFKDGKMVI